MNAHGTRLPSSSPSPRAGLSVSLGLLGGSLIALLVALASGGCGASAESANASAVGGETHFLLRCDAACGDGLDCIAGVCTLACASDDANACDGLPRAECRTQAPGAAGVCDVACDTDAACRGLGGEHSCVEGLCRGPLVSSTAALAGAGGTSSGAAGDSPPDANAVCEAYRDRPGEVEAAVVIRNESGAPLFLQPARSCGNRAPQLVRFDRPVIFADARQVCGSLWCQVIQDEGYESVPCSDDCSSPPLVRLEPGAELEVGRFRSEAVSHGTSGLPRMPDICFSGADPQLLPGVECSAEVPLNGSYQVTAAAFTALDCTLDDEVCDCTPGAGGSCQTGVSSGLGEASASVTFEAGATRAELVFR